MRAVRIVRIGHMCSWHGVRIVRIWENAFFTMAPGHFPPLLAQLLLLYDVAQAAGWY